MKKAGAEAPARQLPISVIRFPGWERMDLKSLDQSRLFLDASQADCLAQCHMSPPPRPVAVIPTAMPIIAPWSHVYNSLIPLFFLQGAHSFFAHSITDFFSVYFHISRRINVETNLTLSYLADGDSHCVCDHNCLALLACYHQPHGSIPHHSFGSSSCCTFSRASSM